MQPTNSGPVSGRRLQLPGRASSFPRHAVVTATVSLALHSRSPPWLLLLPLAVALPGPSATASTARGAFRSVRSVWPSVLGVSQAPILLSSTVNGLHVFLGFSVFFYGLEAGH